MKIVRKSIIKDERNYWDITIPKTHTFILENGTVVHNCGTGVGFSVERQFISKLPTIAEEFYESDSVIVVKDSKIGWATALKELISMLFQGIIPKWDLSLVRKAGAPLKVFGGRASGPEPLNELLKYFVATIKNAAGRKLNSLECNDLFCKIGEAVVVGGVRRCLAKGSKVITEFGTYTTIENIKIGDRVKTLNGYKNVSNIFIQGKQETIKITHQVGELICTKKHKVAVFDSKNGVMWKLAGELEETDCLISPNNKPTLDGEVSSDKRQMENIQPIKIKSIKYHGVVETFDIEVEGEHSFLCEGVLVHNSACISLTNLSDDRMRVAKSGQWWNLQPQRALANISVAYTEKPDIGQFMEEWLSLYNSKAGERGIFNRVAAVKKIKQIGRRNPKPIEESGGVNPCGEIVLRSSQFCNLCEVIIRSGDNLEDILEKVRIATIIGTHQATLTNFRYLRSIWKKNTEEERLLGVSLTGIMDHEVFSGNKGIELLEEWLTAMKEVAIETNKVLAEQLGINQSVGITTVKPSGCTTLKTKVKTSEGIKSMAEIFSELTEENIFENPPHTWIKPFKDMFVFDENDEKKKITKLFINGMSKVYEIEDEIGNTYKFTAEHKLKTTNGWKRVDELSENDEIVSF